MPIEYWVEQTEVFVRWLARLKDQRARVAIARRIERASVGNLGDARSVGEGVSELRIDVGPGYRVYYTRRRGRMIILLCGGNKRRQQADIQKAQRLANEIEP